MTYFVLLVTACCTHVVIQNAFIKPVGRVKLPVVENYKLHGMVGLCKYGHIHVCDCVRGNQA